MTKTLSVDVFDTFILNSDLSFSEMLIYNYSLKLGVKEEVFGYCRRFMTYSTLMTSYDRLKDSYKLISEEELDGKIIIMVDKYFEKDIIPMKVQLGRGRPRVYS